MDRQGHDYAAPMGYGQQQHQGNMPPQQQQQQPFGFHPHQQQFPPSAHGPPFLPPHLSMQQYPFPGPIQQPRYPHPQLLHLQHQRPPSAFPPHLPPHLGSSPYHSSYDSAPPPPAPPPSDPELQKRIDKLVEYSAKNGPEFEAMIREKQQDNPDYGFLFGGDGHNYYRYKLWISTHPPGGPFNPPFPSSTMSVLHPPNSVMSPSPLNTPNAAAGSSPSLMGVPSMHQSAFPPFFEPQHPQHSQNYAGLGRPDYDQSYRNFRSPSKPLPSDVEMEFNNVLNNLTGTKESIKGAKMWFMQRSPFMPLLAEALRDKIYSVDDSERQLHIIYLVNDILFESLQRRIDPRELDNEALAFKPVMGSMLARVYHNPQNREENQSRLQKIVQFWASKEVYDQDSVHAFENEMIMSPPPSFPGSHRDMANIPADLSATTGLLHQHQGNQNASQWHPDRQTLLSSIPDHDKQIPHIPPMPGQIAPQQFHPTHRPLGGFAGSMPMPSVQPAIPQLPTSTANVGEKLPPYPLFPPGLIPGMIRKMQIGSGVPYSPMSPLDIPTVIPPSTASPGEILERVSKFFKEIGEVNPSEGPMKSDSKDDYDDYEREPAVRKGGACIPPPANLHGGTDFADGGSSESGRLGLGASSVPTESNQYDDVYSSYRKQRSTNYHTTMSVRTATR